MKKSIPQVTPKDIIKLNVECNPEEKPPLVWMMAESLRTLWQAKKDKLIISAEEIRTSVEANLTVLKETKLRSLGEGVEMLLTTFFE